MTANQHAEKIAMAMLLCSQRDPAVQALVEAAKADGYVMAIKGVDLDCRWMKTPKTAQDRKPTITVNDRRFLKSLRISTDEPAKEQRP